jgi:hypothetical protein
MTARGELRHIRKPARWREQLERAQRELKRAEQLREKVSIPARRDLNRYIKQIKLTIGWLERLA